MFLKSKQINGGIMKKLVVNLMELGETMNNNSFLIFLKLLDTETGKVIVIFDQDVNEIDLGLEGKELEEFFEKNQDYVKRDFQIAYKYFNDNEDGKYLPIKEIESGEMVEQMREFIVKVVDETKKDEILEKMHGKNTFKRFNKFVYQNGYREEWLKRKEKYLKKYAKEWLESNRIDAIDKG